MLDFDELTIRDQVADSRVIFQRGRTLYEDGAYMCMEAFPEEGRYEYQVDGNYGDYSTVVSLGDDGLDCSCDCPYPGPGCKHVVAVALDVLDRVQEWQDKSSTQEPEKLSNYLTPEEIREKAMEDRRSRARKEEFSLIRGDMIKGDHLLETEQGRQYRITLHDPSKGLGHCSCPDFNTSQLGTCKHLLALKEQLLSKKDLEQAREELFPFVDVYWDSTQGLPRLFCERPPGEIQEIARVLEKYFDQEGIFRFENLGSMLDFMDAVRERKQVRIREEVHNRVDEYLLKQEVEELSREELPSLEGISTALYPYQVEGVRFGLYRKAALIGDEMGLGKTLQAIALGILKKEVFGFNRVLVITLASLKEQWKREIEKFTSEQAVVVAGSAGMRQQIYFQDESLFKITNYEAVLRDVSTLRRFKPDLVILDEAQRIKNFATKTADSVKSLPRKHGLVLTGTPLENKLEDVYSIVQFLEPHMLAPLWKFAADHFMLSREKKDKILGYRNLALLHEKLKPLVIRRRKEEVLKDLPDQVTNTYYLELSEVQAKMHDGYKQYLLPLLNKKFLTPMDVRRIQELLLQMRRVCDSTYLVDRNTRISPKLQELEGILDEIVVQSGRKMVIFSEWTTMTYLIAKQLSRMGINFVELTGKIPVHKRQALIDEFTNNPECKVFLSTDSGGTGLNLQAADCVLNFELPWNPARLNQRIGRVNRIGQTSTSINVINLVSKNSIEEKILAGIHLKTELFTGVFDGGVDMVEFSREKRNQMLNELRAMMGQEMDEDLGDKESRVSEDIPEDTPHFLNPQALAEAQQEDFPGTQAQGASEPEDMPGAEQTAMAGETKAANDEDQPRDDAGSVPGVPDKSPEKMEAVLNQGLEFMSGLLEMATGQKLNKTEEDKPMLKVDKETGEVTMKFRLPGF
ncbi:SNF2-related protein [Desulfonatronospira sp.]|uniref:SNF2-related protein n=1 Tax=Desulfonatronospira sp. TaxID=1962951 RepID=UPI0025C20079|nr:SNF2-related protein [Desulfonatronospira sp.]